MLAVLLHLVYPGFQTLGGTPVVLYAIGPGRHANHQSTFFNQDLDYLETVGKRLTEVYGLQHIGEWHSHHQLGLSHPSGYDARNMRTNVEKLGLLQFLLCIGVCDNHSSTLNAFPFRRGEADYQEARWIIKPMDSPFRKVVDEGLKDILLHPTTTVANIRGLKTDGGKPDYQKGYWLQEKGSGLVLKEMLDCVNALWNTEGKVILDDNKEVHIVTQRQDTETDIHFGQGFPNESPTVMQGGKALGNTAEWCYDGDILNAFKHWLSIV